MGNDGEENGGAGAGASGGAADLLGGSAGSDQGGADQGGADQGAGGDGSDDQQRQQQDGGADPDWYANVSADVGEGEKTSLRDWIKAKGFKDVNSVAKSLRAAEQAIHDSGRVKVPGEGASAKEVAAWRAATGVPDAPTGYEFKPPVGEDGEPIQLNDAMLNRMAETAHKLGLPKAAMESLVSDFIQGELDDLNARQKDLDTQAAAWVKAQGAEANARIAAINTAAAALGLTREDLQGLRMAWGPEKALNIMSKLGAGMAEDTLIGSGTGKFGITGEQAQAELDKLMGDQDWVKKAMTDGTPENARYKRLTDAKADAAERKARAA